MEPFDGLVGITAIAFGLLLLYCAYKAYPVVGPDGQLTAAMYIVRLNMKWALSANKNDKTPVQRTTTPTKTAATTVDQSSGVTV